MSVIGSFDRKKLFAELNDPVSTAEGWKSPADQKAEAITNLGVTGAAIETVNELTSDGTGAIVIPAGSTLEEALQIIIDAID